jgi:hypothetical protein
MQATGPHSTGTPLHHLLHQTGAEAGPPRPTCSLAEAISALLCLHFPPEGARPDLGLPAPAGTFSRKSRFGGDGAAAVTFSKYPFLTLVLWSPCVNRVAGLGQRCLVNGRSMITAYQY